MPLERLNRHRREPPRPENQGAEVTEEEANPQPEATTAMAAVSKAAVNRAATLVKEAANQAAAVRNTDSPRDQK